MHRHHARKGFTLIELLVVIAIIAILAAILFPVFAQAREKARQGTCQSNLKQMGTAMRMYTDDYDGMYIPSYIFGSGWRVCPHYIWPDFVQPYVKNWNVFACPSGVQSLYIDDNARSCPAMGPQPYIGTANNPFRFTYVYNEGWIDAALPPQATPNVAYRLGDYNGMVCGSDPGADLGCHDAAIDEPANTIALADGIPTNPAGSSGITVYRIIRDSDWGNRPTVVRRHGEGFNALFADAHVKWIKRSTFGMWTRQSGD